MSRGQAVSKRAFDLLVAVLGLLLFGWLILLTFIIATIDTRQYGFFRQDRVGMNGKLFKVIKLRTMRSVPGLNSTVTTATDPRITRFGRLFRKSKLDELPQLLNVFFGQMSLVGPRPDVPGFADLLEGPERSLLKIRPGITGPATLFFRNEEELLQSVADPEDYNRNVIFPKKVELNLNYIRNYRFANDLKYIWQTVFTRDEGSR